MGNLKLFCQLNFPAVTVCNHNRINCEVFKAEIAKCTNESTSTSCIFRPESLAKAEELVKACSKRDDINVDVDSGQKKRRKKRRVKQTRYEGDPSLMAEKYYAFLVYYMTLNDSERRGIGHNFTSMVRSCSFAGRDCLNETLVQALFF